MIKVIIVDDEKRSRSTLEKLLVNFCTGVEVLAKAASVDEAKSLIDLHKPDLVFLDIQMPEKDGFELLSLFENIPFKVIFTTAYDEYAIKAIKWSALDYLLKPIDIDELQQALDRANKLETNLSKDQQKIVDEVNEKGRSDRIVIHINSGFKFIKVKDILRLEASGNYTYIFTKEGDKILATKSISDYENLLTNGFFRLHRSHMVNLDCVKEFKKGRSGSVIMTDGMEIAIARDRKSRFLNIFTTE